MMQIVQRNFVFLYFLLSISSVDANYNEYQAAKLFAKYQHNVEQLCMNKNCNTEACVALVIDRVHNDYATNDVDSFANLKNDEDVLTGIKCATMYWFRPNRPNDDQIREQAEKSLENLKNIQSFLQSHTQYINAQNIVALYQQMPVDAKKFELWALQKFGTGSYPMIDCKEKMLTAMSTIDHASFGQQQQYPELYCKLTAIKQNMSRVFPTVENLYRIEFNRKAREESERLDRKLQNDRIDAQNRASQAQQTLAQAHQDKVAAITKLSAQLPVLQLDSRFLQNLPYLQNVASQVDVIRQRLDDKTAEEQRISEQLLTLRTVLNQGIEYQKMRQKVDNLETALQEKNKKMHAMLDQLPHIQRQIQAITIPSQDEFERVNSGLVVRNEQIEKLDGILKILEQYKKLPVAEPVYDVQPSAPPASACYPQNNIPRQPPYNPNYRPDGK